MMCTGRGIYLEKNTENWSGKRDLNPRPSPWQGDALPLSYSRSIAVFEEERGGILLIQEQKLSSDPVGYIHCCYLVTIVSRTPKRYQKVT